MTPAPRRTLLAATTLTTAAVLALTACSGSGTPDVTAAASAPPRASGTIQFWHFFTDREADAIQSVVDDFEAANPGVKVEVKSGQDDQKMRQAAARGQAVCAGAL